MMRDLNTYEWIAVVLVVIGALNWGLIGFFGFNLVAAIFGALTLVTRVIYAIVGLAGLYLVVEGLYRLATSSREERRAHPAM